MPIKVVVVPTRMKRIDVVRVPAEWQEYIELTTDHINQYQQQLTGGEPTS